MVFETGASSLESKKISKSKKADGTSYLTAGQKLSALIVDDDPIIRKIHKALLTKLGLETHTVGDGKEAVDLHCSGKCFHLVLMDKEMPIMDGPRATQELRAMGVKSMIVGVTSRCRDSEKQTFIKAGLNDCYEKPINAATITSLIQELIEKK